MKLHEVFINDVVWVWRFYNAMNVRRGKAHLMRIPLVHRTVFTPPGNLMNEIQRDIWLERQENSSVGRWRAPGHVEIDCPQVQKYCNLTQRAFNYSASYDWNDYRQWHMPRRGICGRCHEYAMSLPDTKTMGPEIILQNHWFPSYLGTLNANTNFEEWLWIAKGNLHNTYNQIPLPA